MRLRLVAALVAVVPLLLIQTPVQADRPDTPPGRAQAERVLEQVQTLLRKGVPDEVRSRMTPGEQSDARSVTLKLRDLRAAIPQLSPADRQTARAILARPTDPSGGGVGERYTVPEAPPVCGPNVCVHYVRTTADAPPMTDSNNDGVPDAVTRTLNIAEKVHTTYVAAGYRRPIGDGSRGGGVNKVDIYLSDLGSQNLYGYCTSDQPESTPTDYTVWAYCSVDDDFSTQQFPNGRTPLENLQVTMAHEYFHAVQFAYDSQEDGWLMEATATWAEDEVYDAVNDNRQYLPYGQLMRPGIPLDKFSSSEGTHYGNWIFFRYLTERFPAEVGGLPVVVREIWEKVSAETGDPDMYSLQGVIDALSERGQTLRGFYAAFADANRRPAKVYEEGAAYPVRAPAKAFRLTSGTRSSGWRYTTQKHLTSSAIRFTPGSGTTQSDWALRINLDLVAPTYGSSVRVTSYKKNGSISTTAIPMAADGTATRVFNFSSGSVKYVELVYVNGSARTRCWVSQTYDPHYSCFGDPQVDAAKQRYRATAFRR
ncbi:hypothetical protein K8W59_02875 [Nocardioides rotundus]|uniref:MXAN_6640 family putative metalloprotease n=1 Tax=Nocardioides rotundus TaxID=1774216 RepID=UPI001CBFA491|nr:MXAN_6640 family putative metalloprotease [Nocardioides rotundus]UAL30486.1 hypothetical protein K8W59_02875 [Nocardioides rotundus]